MTTSSCSVQQLISSEPTQSRICCSSLTKAETSLLVLTERQAALSETWLRPTELRSTRKEAKLLTTSSLIVTQTLGKMAAELLIYAF